jgi:hypothetical protein
LDEADAGAARTAGLKKIEPMRALGSVAGRRVSARVILAPGGRS